MTNSKDKKRPEKNFIPLKQPNKAKNNPQIQPFTTPLREKAKVLTDLSKTLIYVLRKNFMIFEQFQEKINFLTSENTMIRGK